MPSRYDSGGLSMPCFSAAVNYTGRPLTSIWAAGADSDSASAVAKGLSLGQLQSAGVESCQALVDTGAERSCITEQLAAKLQLSCQGITQLNSASGSVRSKLYSVNFHIQVPVGADCEDDQEEIQRRVLGASWMDVEVMSIPGIDDSFDAVLGMDVIHRGAFHVSGRQFTFCI